MRDWNEVVEELRRHHTLVVEKATWVGLAWRFGESVQRQRVEVVKLSGREQLVISCDVLPLAQISPLVALRHNATLPVGALAVEGTTCVLRCTAPIEELGPQALQQLLAIIAHEAMRLRALRRHAAAPAPYVVD